VAGVAGGAGRFATDGPEGDESGRSLTFPTFLLVVYHVYQPPAPAASVRLLNRAGSGFQTSVLLAGCPFSPSSAGSRTSSRGTYLLGSRLGEPAYRRLFKGDEGKKRYDWAHRVLDGQGVWIIPTARFVPGGRTAVTFSAGTVSMRWRRFFLADLSAGLIWATYSSLLGYIGGRAFESSSWKSYVMAFGIAGAIALGGIVYWRVVERRSSS
jgi:membrane-associated protein